MPMKWRTLKSNLNVRLLCFAMPIYSPSGKFLLDCIDSFGPGARTEILIVNIETNCIKKYGTIQEIKEIVFCAYWLNDEEIVVITQVFPRTETTRSVYYRLYTLDHEEGVAELVLKWQYLLPRKTSFLQTPNMYCSNPLIVRGYAFCVVQVGFDLVLLPWDVRWPSPSYPPKWIEISVDMIDGHKIRTPDGGDDPCKWCNIYCFEDSIYLEIDRPNRTLTDRFARLNLSQMDLTCYQASPDLSLVKMDRQTPNVEYEVRWHCTQQWQQGQFLIKMIHASNLKKRRPYENVFVTNFKDQTVSVDTVKYYQRYVNIFTLFNNKFVCWKEFHPKSERKQLFQYNVQTSNILRRMMPIPSLRQLCWERIYLTPERTTEEKKKLRLKNKD